MGENSKIEWTTHTFNPWLGCQKVSPGCDKCYAEALMDTRLGRVKWGPHGERVRTSEANWRKPIQRNAKAKAAKRRDRVFCASLADWLDNRVPQQWRVDLAGVIRATPHLDWLLLTKRIENFARLSPFEAVPANVWLGVTAEDQAHYDRRWPILHAIEAPIRFISYEPAIGPLTDLHTNDHDPDWIILGGESGPSPRLMEPPWAYDVNRMCEQRGVALFVKQMTAKSPIPADLLVRQFPVSATMREAG